MRFLYILAIAVSTFAAPAANAAPVGLAGADTRVLVTADLEGLGLTPSLQGSATFENGAINFPITGGSLDFTTLAGEILHEGSGVFLSDGSNSVFAGNFIIDTTNQTIFGDVVLNDTINVGDDLPLFSFDLSTITAPELLDLDNPSLSLLITATLAGALTEVFGAPDLEGAEFGLAATLPQPVPVPGALGLFLAGAGVLHLMRRRRSIA